jgi:hypothetical protein
MKKKKREVEEKCFEQEVSNDSSKKKEKEQRDLKKKEKKQRDLKNLLPVLIISKTLNS